MTAAHQADMIASGIAALQLAATSGIDEKGTSFNPANVNVTATDFTVVPLDGSDAFALSIDATEGSLLAAVETSLKAGGVTSGASSPKDPQP